MLLRLYQPVCYPVSFLKEGRKNKRGKGDQAWLSDPRPFCTWANLFATRSAGLAGSGRPIQPEARPDESVLLTPFPREAASDCQNKWRWFKPPAGRKYDFHSPGREGKAQNRPTRGPTMDRGIRFDTLDLRTWCYWKVGHNDRRNYKIVIWMTVRKNSTWAVIKSHLYFCVFLTPEEFSMSFR